MRDEIRNLREESQSRVSQRSATFDNATKTLLTGISSINTIASVLRKTVQEVNSLRETVNELRALVHSHGKSASEKDLQTGLEACQDDVSETSLPEDNPYPVLAPYQNQTALEEEALGDIGTSHLTQRTKTAMTAWSAGGADSWNSRPVEPTSNTTHPRTFAPTTTQLPIPKMNFRSAGEQPSAAVGKSYRKPQRVSEWKIGKYAGTDEGMNLNEFLESVLNYAACEQITEEELFNSAMHLFTDRALAWYQTMRAQNRLFNWNHLVCELRANFVHPELDATLRMKVAQRRQQRNESFLVYYLEMEKIFRAMMVPMTLDEKLDVLKRNLRAEYKQMLILRPVNTLAELMSLGKSIDASKTPIYHKVFGLQREVAMVTGYSEPKTQSVGNKNSGLPNGGMKTRRFWNRTVNFAPSNSKQSTGMSTKPFRSQSSANLPGSKPIKPLQNSHQHKGIISLEYLVNNHRPPGYGVCYNCGDSGHNHETCFKTNRIFCVVCGFKGFEVSRCPYCRKHGIGTN